MAFLLTIGLFWYVPKSPEHEFFRFGNQGRLLSSHRYRVPIVFGKTSGYTWISAVDTPAIGLLIGKDVRHQGGLAINYPEDL